MTVKVKLDLDQKSTSIKPFDVIVVRQVLLVFSDGLDGDPVKMKYEAELLRASGKNPSLYSFLYWFHLVRPSGFPSSFLQTFYIFLTFHLFP